MKQILPLLLAGFLFILSDIALADTETVNWYVDGSLYDTTYCQPGGDIVLPTAPTKSGYLFLGWDVFSLNKNLDVNINASALYSKEEKCYTITNNVMNTPTLISCNDASISDLNQNESKAVFSYGTIHIQGLCSNTTGTAYVFGTPNESSSGSRCWCRLTKFNNVKLFGSDQWFYFNNGGYGSDTCTQSCAYNCARAIGGALNNRQTVFSLY
jgi:hypothetical protein